MSSAPLYLAIVVVWLIVLVPMLLRRDPADSAQIRRTDREADDGAFDDLDADDAGDDISDDRGTAGVPRARGGHDDDPDRTLVLRRDELPGVPFPAEPGDDGPHTDTHADIDPGTYIGSGIGTGTDAAIGTDADADAAIDTDADSDADHEHDPAAMREEGLPPRRRGGRARVIARRRRRTTGLGALFAATATAVVAGLGPWWVLIPPAVLLLGHLALLREAAKADAERRAADLARARRRRSLIRARRAEEEAAREAQVLEFMARTGQVYDQYTDAQQRAAGD
ncbi:hypothetical protein ACFO4E_17280 [Nocardiopsis mangrovi]|uniref:Uncharacterized protein n=1 Tax=Nocardiopsis mangrovi TaxID=1179818 RepID=A0ABV9DYT8_9ACTN